MDHQRFKNSRKMLSLQQKGGYTTLTQLAVIPWYGLTIPILAGIITTAIASW